MCLPAAVVGIVTAVTSVVGSIASYSQQQQQVKYQNAVAQQEYQIAQQRYAFAEQQHQLDLKQYGLNVDAYNRSVEGTKEQYRLNAESANRAYIAEQNKLRAEYQRSSQDQQKLLVSSLQAQGTVLASGRSGQSVGLLMSDAERNYGRDLASLGMNLAWAENDFFTANQSAFLQAQSSNNATASNQMVAPAGPPLGPGPAPVAPIKMPKPSPIGLIAGVAGAGLAGYDAYSALKAPKATTPAPRPIPIPGGQLPGGRAGTVIQWG
jgi:uncharacterized protein YxeA